MHRRSVAVFLACLLLACSSSEQRVPPPKPSKPLGPPPAPEPPEIAARAQPPGLAWLAKPAPHGIALGVDDVDSVAQKLGIELSLRACRKDGPHWSDRKAGRLKGNYRCAIEKPSLERAQRLELGFVDLGKAGVVIDMLGIVFDAAEWDGRVAALEAEYGRADVSFATSNLKTWSWGRHEIQLERTPDKPRAVLRHVDRNAARLYLKRAIKSRLVPRIVPQPKTIPPVEPWGLVFAHDEEPEARQKLIAAGFSVDSCRDMAKAATEGRVMDCALSGAPLSGLRSARVQLVDLGDGRMRLAALEYSFDPSRFAHLYGEIEAQYGSVEQESSGTENEATWWIEPVQISMLGNASMLLVSYRHGRLAQIGANLIARSNQATMTAPRGGL